MGKEGLDPSQAQQVIVTEHLYGIRGDTEPVTVSENFLEILGYALDDKVGGLVVINVGAEDLRVQQNGTDASLTSGLTLKAGASETYFGDKALLETYEFFSDVGTNVSFEQLVSTRGK